jgi:uncharacterized protein
MNMTQVAAALFQLQQIDLELDRLKVEKQNITTSLQGSAILRRLRAEYDTTQQQLLSGQQMQQEAEWTLEDINRRLATQEQRIYSGSVRNARELQSLQQEAQNLRAQQNRQEERLLEAIDVVESTTQLAQQKAVAVQQAEAAWEQERTNLQTRADQNQKHWQALQDKRQQITIALNDDIVKRYESMRKSKQGRAISKIEQNSCQWCRVILTPSELQKVRLGQELQTCLNCGRILYYER